MWTESLGEVLACKTILIASSAPSGPHGSGPSPEDGVRRLSTDVRLSLWPGSRKSNQVLTDYGSKRQRSGAKKYLFAKGDRHGPKSKRENVFFVQ